MKDISNLSDDEVRDLLFSLPKYSTKEQAQLALEQQAAAKKEDPEKKDRGLLTLKESALSTDSYLENPLDVGQYVIRDFLPKAKAARDSEPLNLLKGAKKKRTTLKRALKGGMKGGVYGVVIDWAINNFVAPSIASAITGDEWTPKDVDDAQDLALTEAWRFIQDSKLVPISNLSEKKGRGAFKAFFKEKIFGTPWQKSIDLTVLEQAQLLQKKKDQEKKDQKLLPSTQSILKKML